MHTCCFEKLYLHKWCLPPGHFPTKAYCLLSLMADRFIATSFLPDVFWLMLLSDLHLHGKKQRAKKFFQTFKLVLFFSKQNKKLHRTVLNMHY